MKKSAMIKAIGLAALFLSVLLPEAAYAQLIPGLISTPAPGGATAYSLPIQTLLMMTILGFLPSMMLMMTGFTRIIIVLSLLRMAIGTQNSPPNQVIIGLSMFLTIFVMTPTLNRVYDDAIAPYSENKISFETMLKTAETPIREFMTKQTRKPDIALFLSIARVQVNDQTEVPFRVLVPAFITSELKSAFQIGFMIFMPFLIIDLIVASVLMSMGMMMLSPMLISLPFKIMLFVLVDGWTLIIGSLAKSFAT